MFFSPRTSPIRKNLKPKDSPRRGARTSTPSAKSCCGREKIPVWMSAKVFSALRDPAVQKIAIANPAHAPYGRAAEEALRQAGVYDAVKDRLVLGENISQAAEFVGIRKRGRRDPRAFPRAFARDERQGPRLEHSGEFVRADSAGRRGGSRVDESARRAAISRLHQDARDGCAARAIRIRSSPAKGKP